MYPAQALVDGLYSVADLPDEILVNNVLLDLYDTVFTKTGGILSFYEATHNGELMSVRIKNYIDMTETERNVWVLLAYGEEFGLSSMPECLITEAQDEDSASKDTFADSYTVTDNALGYLPSPVSVNRIGLCQWQASFAGTLYFGNPDNPPATGNWIVNINTDFMPFEVIYYWQNLENPDDFYYPNQQWTFRKNGPPTEPNSSPSGSYSGGEFGSISVS